METGTGVAGRFDQIAGPAGAAFVSEDLQRVARHLFTTRAAGAPAEPLEETFSRVAAALDVPRDRLASVVQVHGRDALIIRRGDPPATVTEADIVISLDAEVAVAVRVADCVPLLIADREGRAVAAVHAGWRGTALGAAATAVTLLSEAGIAPESLVVAIGPSIGPCCYQVDARVRDRFLGIPGAASWFDGDGPGRWKFDLRRANVAQLAAAGVAPEAVFVSAMCTAHHLDSCFSYRAEGPGTGRMVAAIRASGAT